MFKKHSLEINLISIILPAQSLNLGKSGVKEEGKKIVKLVSMLKEHQFLHNAQLNEAYRVGKLKKKREKSLILTITIQGKNYVPKKNS